MIFDFTTLQNRRNRAAKKLADVMGPKDLLLVYAGEPIQRPGGLDQTYSYQPHPNYYWLSGRRRVSGVMTFSQSEGWQDYTKPHAPEETLWEGTTPDPQAGRDIAELATSLKSHQKIIPIGQVPAELFNHPKVASREERFNLQVKFEQARRIKDAAEIELIENIARIANRGYERIQAILKPGITEREIRIEYEAEIQRAGSLGIPYGTIVGTGSNAAILHAEPSSRMVAPDDLVLIDAGAEIHDYCVDITRVYPASGKFDSKRQAIYDTVKKAQAASIALMKPDVEWKDVHAASARVIAQGLRDLGILNCSADEALASGAVSVFFPHGVGHLVGLRVRDTGHIENTEPKHHYGVRLRVDFPLEENYLMTVEPGCYFVEALINHADVRARYAPQINWTEVERFRGIGGVRIEDDLLVTASGTRNLTDVVSKL